MKAPPREYYQATMWRSALRLVPALGVLALWLTGHTTMAVTLFCTVSVIVAYLVLSPYTRLLGPIVTEMEGSNLVFITIDDGPHPDTTPGLLDLLDQHQTKAVFFVIGDRVNRWPELAKAIVERGHTIGNHTMTHPAAMFWSLGPWRTWAEIVSCQDAIREATGVEAKWFRAPVGHFNFFTHPALKALDMKLMSWSARGFDGVDGDVESVVKRIEKGLRPGAIVLMHEGRPSALEIMSRVLRSSVANRSR